MIDMLFDTKDSPSKTLYSGVFEGESLADGKDTSAVGAACFHLRPRDVVFGSEREVYWRCFQLHNIPFPFAKETAHKIIIINLSQKADALTVMSKPRTGWLILRLCRFGTQLKICRAYRRT